METAGAFAVIFDSFGRVLLCHRTDRDAWNLPGGRVENGETPEQAVMREVVEEVGLEVRVVTLLGIYSVPEKQDVVYNFFCIPMGGALTPSEEADQIAWFDRAAIPSNTLPPHIARIEDAYRNVERTPST